LLRAFYLSAQLLIAPRRAACRTADQTWGRDSLIEPARLILRETAGISPSQRKLQFDDGYDQNSQRLPIV